MQSVFIIRRSPTCWFLFQETITFSALRRRIWFGFRDSLIRKVNRNLGFSLKLCQLDIAFHFQKYIFCTELPAVPWKGYAQIHLYHSPVFSYPIFEIKKGDVYRRNKMFSRVHWTNSTKPCIVYVLYLCVYIYIYEYSEWHSFYKDLLWKCCPWEFFAPFTQCSTSSSVYQVYMYTHVS